MSSWLVQLFCVRPALDWILRRYKQPKGLRYAGVFLVLVAIGTIWYDTKDQPPNFYSYLDVDVAASSSDIKRAYRAASLRMHPDKNPGNPNADQEFAYLSQVYTVLSDATKRGIYDRLGPDGLKQNRPESEISLLMEIGAFYVFWLVLAWFFTSSDQTAGARSWAFAALAILLFIECKIKLSSYNPLGSYLSFLRITPYQQVDLMHHVVPSFIHGARTMAAVSFFDLKKYQTMLLTQILKNQQVLNTRLETLERHGLSGRGKVDPTVAGSGPAILGGLGGPDLSGQGAGGLTTAALGTRRLDAPAGAPVQPMGPPPKKGGIPPMVWTVGIMILFNWVLK